MISICFVQAITKQIEAEVEAGKRIVQDTRDLLFNMRAEHELFDERVGEQRAHLLDRLERVRQRINAELVFVN